MNHAVRLRALLLSSCLVATISSVFLPPSRGWGRELPATGPAERPATKSSDFLRLLDKGATGSRLETADVAFRNAEGVTVYLVSAVHVGEREYFEGLNESFKLRDVVLYEMVKPKDAPLPQKGEPAESHSAISSAQRMMKDVLGLEFQLDVIDYSAANFAHADLDAETFQKMQDERGESFATMFLQALMKQMRQPPADGARGGKPPASELDDVDAMLEDLVRMLARPDMENQLKMRLARQLVDMENSPLSPEALEGTVLLTERNKAALAALDKAFSAGKRDIALFYGAAHMPDFAKRLAERGFKPVSTQWRMAWNLTIRPDAPSAVEKLLMELIKGAGDGDD